MATEPPVTTSGGMVDRIKGILLKPKEEFAKIDAEPMTVQGIMVGWVAPLAAIGPIAGVVGLLIFGINILGFHWTPSPTYLISQAIAGWVVALVCAFLFGLIVNALAPTFGGKQDQVAGLKVAAFGATAGYVAGIISIVPMLTPLIWLALLYNIYLIWIALPLIMKVPADKAAAYVGVAILCWIVLVMVAGWIVVQMTMQFAPMPTVGDLNLRL